MSAAAVPALRAWRPLLPLLLLWLALGGAVPPLRAQAIVIHDDRGSEFRFERPPQRIVTMLPSLTETAWVLGVGPRLVGVDRYSNWPPEVAALPHLGGLEDAQIEAIAALAPDLVLASISSRAMDRLQALGLRVARFRSESHADVRHTVERVARLLGREAESVRVLARIERELDAAAARVPAALRGARVYFEIGGGPYAAGASSFIGQTLTRLALVNVVPAELGPFPKLNPEFVVRARPELIIGVQRELASIAQRPGWASIPAVRQGRLCGFETTTYDLLVRPGPRMGEAAGLLVDCMLRVQGEQKAAPR